MVRSNTTGSLLKFFVRSPSSFSRHPFDIQHTLCVDPSSLRLSTRHDSSSRPNGTAIEALAGVVHHAVGSHQGARAWILLTEFPDPDASITYFRAPDIDRQVREDDEIFKGNSK